MNFTLEELREKNVVNIKDGINFGCVDDIIIDTENATVVSIVIYGKKKFFGLFGREPDLVIAWNDITTIGNDVVLVNVDEFQNSYLNKNYRTNNGNKQNFIKMFFK